MEEIKINKLTKSITFINNGIAFSQFGIADEILDLIEHQNKEIERLNNIIEEFDKWLLGEKMMFYKSDDGERLIRYGETKNKWLELKERK